MESKEEIMKKGWIEVHIFSGGVRRRHILNVRKEKTMWGVVPFLVCEVRLPQSEVLRLAEELKLPIKAGDISAFPRGKSLKDFVIREEEPAGLP